MKPADGKRFVTELVKMADAFDTVLSESRIRAYFERLDDFHIDDVVAAMGTAMDTLKFFPKIAELRELIEGDPDARAEVAWTQFLFAVQRVGSYQSVDFRDEVLHEVVRSMWGGWDRVAEALTEDETPYRHAEFVKLYRALAEEADALGAARPMLGKTAIDNTAKGFLQHVPDPVNVVALMARQRQQLPPGALPPKELGA